MLRYINSEMPQPCIPFTWKVHIRSWILASHSHPMYKMGESTTFTWTLHVRLAVNDSSKKEEEEEIYDYNIMLSDVGGQPAPARKVKW